MNKSSKPIIQMLLSLFAFVLVICATAPPPANAAEPSRYPTQYDFQDIITETLYGIAENREKHDELANASEAEAAAYVIEKALDTADQWGTRNNVTITAAHTPNILLTLQGAAGNSKYWNSRPYCSDYKYRQLLYSIFPNVHEAVALNLAHKMNGCRLETL